MTKEAKNMTITLIAILSITFLTVFTLMYQIVFPKVNLEQLSSLYDLTFFQLTFCIAAVISCFGLVVAKIYFIFKSKI